jgi:WD40 repeat protein
VSSNLCRILLMTAGLLTAAAPTFAQTSPDGQWAEVDRLEVGCPQAQGVVYSPDGKYLTAVSVDRPTEGEIKSWNVATGQVLFALKIPSPMICVAYAPDGKMLACAEQGSGIVLRDASNGNVLRALKAPNVAAGVIQAISFSPDDKFLATDLANASIPARIWNTASGELVRTLSGTNGRSMAVAFGGGPGLVATCGGADGLIRFWSIETGDVQFTLAGHRAGAQCLAFSPDGKTLASGGTDKMVRLWDVASKKLLAILSGHNDPVLALAFSPDGKTLASAGGPGLRTAFPKVKSRGEAIVWDLAADKGRARITAADRIMGLAFSKDSGTLALASGENVVALWKPVGSTQAKKEFRQSSAVGDDVTFTMAFGAGSSPKGPELPKTFAKEYRNSLKSNADQKTGIKILAGPDGQNCVQFDAEGLRINLPNGYPKPRPGTGVITDFGVRGNFEITVGYEILPDPEPSVPARKGAILLKGGPFSKGAEVSLAILPYQAAKPDLWLKADQNRAYLSRQLFDRASDGHYLAGLSHWNSESVKDAWGNEIFDKKETYVNHAVPTEGKAGKLRLARMNSTLYFYASEADSPEFTLLHQDEFGTGDLKNVRLLATTSGPQTWLDVRLTDLTIRADELPMDLTASKAAGPGHGGLALMIILGVIFAGAVALGIVFLSRRRRPLPLPQVTQEEKPSLVVFACGACGKRLKSKSELAGKKIKCPGCGQAVQVPSGEEEIP